MIALWGVRSVNRLQLLFVALVLVSGCATDRLLTEAREHFEAGRGEQALAMLEKAHKAQPENLVYRTEYMRARDLLIARWLGQAETLRLSAEFELAEALYRRAQKQDPENPRARSGLAQIEADRRHRLVVGNAERLVKAGKHHEAEALLRQVLVENPHQRAAQRLQKTIEERTAKPAVDTPRLRAGSQPIMLELRDVPLRSVFDVIARAAGISFVFDKDVRTDLRTTIAVQDATVDELIRVVLATHQLEQKIINEKTVVVFPNTAQKLREYQELVVRGFYLANADVKQTANMIRAIVKTRDIFIDEKLSLVVIKDTPQAVRMAERLIAAQDLAEPEVMLEVEVLEIGYSKLLELGLRYPETLAFSVVGAGGVPGTLTLPEWLNRSSELVRLSVTNPMFMLTLRQQDGATSVLANPRIRVKNKEKAKIHIGDRVPVITTTAAATGGFISESVSYLDVGLKLEVEPLIHLVDEVGIKVGLEVSNIVREVRGTTTGTLTYQIGTRNASTVLRLKDGETQILAGLISDEDRRNANRVPGLGELPILGRLFTATRDTIGKTEVMLLITPRVIRVVTLPDTRMIEFAAGTEAGASGAAAPPAPFLRAVPTAPPTTAPQPAPKPPTPFAPFAPPAPVPRTPEMVPFGGVQPGSAR